ncbi:Sphingoid long chain base kinase 4 [Grifola frondosa]|uniref:Sphingoid long chain base kinase 4 n=1 Tax=Grifola frondosa TaxID=5627 RepID=A0A1C7MG59_GRIFR|nr:Sphingoid long chain base kinase 4 [Grifola frondosa]
MTVVKRELIVGSDGKFSTFILTDSSLVVKRVGDNEWPVIETSLRHVLWAGLDGDTFEVSALMRRNKKAALTLVHIIGKVEDKDRDAVLSFTTSLTDAAYLGLKKQRKLKVLVNPHSGPGKAVSQYHRKVEPIFRAARCNIDLTFTTRAKHASDLMKDLPLDQYDAIVAMSGDGLIHEILNGFAAHAEPGKAFDIPITPIPTGSGNGLALNLLGIEDGRDISAAALNAIKGHPMKIDLFSVTQKDQRYLSFMSQTLGLMADADLGTEYLRFMGSNRFIVGFLNGVLKMKHCPVKLSIKVSESDKKKMVRDLHASRSKAQAQHGPASDQDIEQAASGSSRSASTSLPPLKYAAMDSEGWITFEKPMLYLYAGKGPYVSRDFMQFPVSTPNDGLIDVIAQSPSTRGELLKAMDGAEKGEPFWLDSQHYFKAHAYRIEPHSSEGLLAIDGEAYPFEAYQVEVHQGLATLLSPYGYYQADFNLPGETSKAR